MISKLGLPISARASGHIVVGVCITVIIFNLLEAIQLAYLWNALKWEPETEWDEWRMNGVRVVVGLVCGYLIWTCCAAFVGLLGALKHKPSYLRFFRDSTIVDLVFSFMFTIVTAFCASRQSTRALLCEQLSRQPELLRSVANSGLNFENCELWFENAVVVFTCVMLVTLVMRVQFTFTLSNFYTRLLRKQRLEPFDSAPRRILLLPPSADIPLFPSHHHASGNNTSSSQPVLVYAPVRQTFETAHELGATEAWVSNRRHGHGHGYDSGSSRASRAGLIQLEIAEGEGLLPAHAQTSAPLSSPTNDRHHAAHEDDLEDWRQPRTALKRI